ncbi:MAG: M13 family metallopeptidase [Ginsengibacter sp.]
MDTSVRPQDNFFLYVNGGWIKQTEIPPTESGMGAGLDLYNLTKNRIHGILDSVAKLSASKGSIEQKVGDLYASGMDSITIDKMGHDPIKPILQKVAAFKSPQDVINFEAEQQKINAGAIFGLSVGSDEKNSSKNILIVSQTGLGLPDRDYYYKTDAATSTVVNAYKNYAKQVFMLLGEDSVTSTKLMNLVYALEKQLASSHKTNVELRDPVANYHKMAVADVDKQIRPYSFKNFLISVGIKTDSVNVQQPGYYEKLSKLLSTVPVSTWSAYYAFATVRTYANTLSTPFVNAAFDYSKTLSGQKQMKPRWERLSRVIDANLGDALGQLYVKKYFTDDARNRMKQLVENLQIAFENRISKLDWMSDSTKTVAKEKLHAFLKKIGYTDKWRDYSKVTISKTTYFNNLQSTAKNEFDYQVSKIDKPVDRTEWGMTPPTINAYYNPTFNEIVFPAGILQFPFFDTAADDAINYGGIGMVIGHEMTHGFDDQGAQYDKEGNMKNWWSKDDNTKFKLKTKSVIDLYNSFIVLDTVHVNGALTTGENMADLGGIKIAYDAFKLTKEGKDSTKIDGFTPDQRFFISYAQIWRSKQKDESVRARINGDPHSPPMYRVNGPLMNFDAFYKAFNVKEGDKMYKSTNQRIVLW